MDTMSRFRRRVKPKPPPIETAPVERTSSDSGTSSNGGAALGPSLSVSVSVAGNTAASPASIEPSSAKSDRLAPWRSLRLRSSSTKRARSRTPNGQPGSPSIGSNNAPPSKVLASSRLLSQEAPRPMTAPSTRPAPSPLPNGRNGQAKPQLPSFLMSPSLDIDNKYQDLTWAERERCAEAVRHKNTPEFRWGHFNNPMYMDKFGNCMDRYGNVKPWNHNRVRLKVPEKKLDYVNASTITVNPLKEGSLPPLRFIAMQGPTEGSFQFVWRMITEQTTSPAVIVQLTTMSEGGNEKCDQYFPLDGPGPHATWRLNEDDVWGDGWYAQLTNEHVEKLEDGAIEKRKLVLRMLKKKRKQAKKEDSDDDSDKGMDLKVDSSDDDMSDDDEEDASDDDDTSDNIEYLEGHEPLVIWHFLYRRWPDFRVPQGEDLPSFFKLMTLSREYCSNDSPRIIHCSAGVGRTGTFISLEHMMRELEAGSLESWDAPPGRTHSFRGRVGAKERAPGRDLVYDTVDCLRQQRKLMVQSPSQYRFLYQVMRRLWVEKYGGSVSDDDEEKITTRPLGFLDKPAVEEDPVSDMDADGADGPDIGGGVAIGDIL